MKSMYYLISNHFKKFMTWQHLKKKEQLLYKDSLSLFQKIIVMRTMRLDRSNDFLIDYVKAILGTEFTNPTMFNISDVFNQSTSEEPGIIISAPMKS